MPAFSPGGLTIVAPSRSGDRLGGSGGPPQTDPSPALTPRQAALLQLWRDRRGRRPIPLRSDIDVLDLWPWLGYLHLLEVLEDGRDLRYRVHGTMIASRIGVEMTGKRLSEQAEENRKISWEIYRPCLRSSKPYLEVRNENFWMRVPGFRRLVLPLATEIQAISHLLVLLEDLLPTDGSETRGRLLDD